MAILAPNGIDPNNPNNNQANTGGGGTVMNSAAGTGNPPGVTAGGGGGTSTASNTAARPTNPGGIPNVQDYLNANQGAGQRLASGITSNVQNQANQITSQANTNQQQLSNQYSPLNNTLQGGQSAANTAFQDPQALLTAYQNAQAQSAQGQNYAGAAPDQSALSNYNAFQGDVQGSNQYNQNQQQIQNYGTTGQQDYNNLQTQLGNLGQQTSAGTNELGRSQLLQNTVGNPNYNQGQQTLDSLFLQGQGPQLQQSLTGIQNNTAANVTGLNNDYQSKLSALQNLAGQNTSYAQNLFLNGPGTAAGAPQGSGLNQIANNVNNEYTALQASALAAQAAALSAAQNDQRMTPDQMAQLGLTAGTNTWGLTNLTPYVQTNALTGNAQAATPEEYARYNALNQIAGNGGNPLQTSIFGSQAAPTTRYTPVSFNSNQFATDVGARKQAINSQFQPALQAALANFGVSGGTNATGGVGGSANNQNPGTAAFLTNLQQQMASGNLTPDQANTLYNQQIQSLQNQGENPTALAGFEQSFNPFTQYYNNTYEPAATATLGNGLAGTGTQSGIGRGSTI